MKKVFSAILVFVLLSGGAGYWTLRQFEKNIRSELNARLSEITGQEAIIGGEVKMRFPFSPSVRLNDIKIPASCGKESFCMLRIGRLTVELKLFPLLNRRTEIKRLIMTDADFEITRRGSRFLFVQADTAEARVDRNIVLIQIRRSVEEKTFDLTATVEKKISETYAFSVKSAGTGFSGKAAGNISFPLSKAQGRVDFLLTLDDASLLNKMIAYRLPALENISVRAETAFEPDKISVSGFEIKAGTNQTALVRAQGSVDSLSPLSARFHAEVDAPDMGAVKGLPAWPATAFSADVELNDGFVLDNLKMTVGDSDLSGRIVRKTEKDIRIQAYLRSDRFRLADGGGKIVYPMAGLFSFSKGKRTKLFSDEPFPFEKIKSVKVDIDLSTNHFIAANGADLGQTAFKAGMRDGVFSVPDFKLADYISARILWDASKRPAELKAGLTANKVPLSLFFFENQENGMINGTLRLTGKGISEEQTAASLNGRVFFDLRSFYVESRKIFSLPDELEVLFPVGKTQPFSVFCAVVNVPVENGIVPFGKGVGAESEFFNAQINGSVNLADEKLNLNLDVSPRFNKGWASVFDAATLKGTILRPEIRLNADRMIDKALSFGMSLFAGGGKNVQQAMPPQKLKNVCAVALTEGK